MSTCTRNIKHLTMSGSRSNFCFDLSVISHIVYIHSLRSTTGRLMMHLKWRPSYLENLQSLSRRAASKAAVRRRRLGIKRRGRPAKRTQGVFKATITRKRRKRRGRRPRQAEKVLPDDYEEKVVPAFSTAQEGVHDDVIMAPDDIKVRKELYYSVQ